MPTVICKECGMHYEANVSRNGYCENCRAKKIAESKHRYYEKRKLKRAELRKEFAECERCHRKFNPVNSRQTLCEKCQLAKDKEAVMTLSNKIRSEKSDVIQIRVPKGRREKMKDFARSTNRTMTEVLLEGYRFMVMFEDLTEQEQKAIIDIINSKRK